MKLYITECKLSKNEIYVTAKFLSTLDEIERRARPNEYCYGDLAKLIAEKIADAVADEYLQEHKLALINAMGKEDIVKAIQLKIIENFSIQGSNR